jgi:hypothetical protein
MKRRSVFEICLPVGLFVGACALSLPTLIIAVAWMTVGVVSLGHRPLESFPTDGMRREWLRGYRGACLWFYHLAWWPWYMRSPLRHIAARIGNPRSAKSGLPHAGTETSPDKLSDGLTDGHRTDTHRDRKD